MNRKAKTLLVLALVVVVGMAFRVSWNALRDIAKAIGADDTAATLYPFVVDGLMALALVAGRSCCWRRHCRSGRSTSAPTSSPRSSTTDPPSTRTCRNRLRSM